MVYVYYCDPSKAVPYVCKTFNDKVSLYNKYMQAAMKSFDNIDFGLTVVCGPVSNIIYSKMACISNR